VEHRSARRSPVTGEGPEYAGNSPQRYGPEGIKGASVVGGVDDAALHLHVLPMTIDKSVRGTGEASPIGFRLDPNSGVPTYLQIVQQVEQALRLGYLVKGDQLPKVREVVAALAINPNTVLKAYRELEHKGLAAGRPGQGTFIEDTLVVVPLQDQQALKRGLTRWLIEATEAGLDEEGIAALFASALHDLRRQGKGVIAS
jgi:GntR family transcriptional regulator